MTILVFPCVTVNDYQGMPNDFVCHASELELFKDIGKYYRCITMTSYLHFRCSVKFHTDNIQSMTVSTL